MTQEMVPLKHLSSFWIIPEIILINCETYPDKYEKIILNFLLI